MNSENNVIGPMTKVALEIRTETTSGGESRAPVSFDFIFGIGVNGLSGLEMHLAGLKKGATAKIEVEPETVEELFGHLGCGLMRSLECQPPFFMQILVKDVTPAKPRDVVRAMAANTECGCDCGCGCF